MIQLNQSGVYLCECIEKDIEPFLEHYNSNQIFVLSDETTKALCIPLLKNVAKLNAAHHFSIKPTDSYKNLEALASIWSFLGAQKATRKSLLINIGGGMISDIGGFAGSTYKRGLTIINIPTTLLSVVDAAVGGKTGINFENLKNQIGVIRQPEQVLIDIQFLKTLDRENLLSGYAEMLKHGLISNPKHWADVVSYDTAEFDLNKLKPLMWESVAVKEAIVKEDPYEKGIRKALNFGHTVGHAFESISHSKNQPVLHGIAVAAGIIPELYLSKQYYNFPTELFDVAIDYIVKNYPSCPYIESDFETAFELMTHDKKNDDSNINFTLLSDIGAVKINSHCSKERIKEALDFYVSLYK